MKRFQRLRVRYDNDGADWVGPHHMPYWHGAYIPKAYAARAGYVQFVRVG